MLPCRAPGQDRGGKFRSFWGSPELALDRHQGRVRVSQEKRRCCSIFEHRLIHLKEYQTAAGIWHQENRTMAGRGNPGEQL